MSPGTHQTTGFDPVGGPSAPSRLTYTVGEGWKVKEDRRTTLTLDHIVDGAGAQPPTGPILVLMADPVMTADLDAGAPCGPIADAPAVGTGLDDLVAAIRARPGVVSTPPATVTIGGHRAQVLDLQLAPSWTGGCRAPDGLIVGLPLLRDAGSTAGPVVGLGTDRPLRLILVDVGDGRTMVGAIFDIGTTRPAEFAADVAQSMPIVEGLEFRPAPP